MAENSDHNLRLYIILEVPKTATPEEIQASYRRLAMNNHPDKNQDDIEGAEERMKEINYAYKILNDPDLRHIYDRGGSAEVKRAEQFREYRVYQSVKEGPWYVKAVVVLCGILTLCYCCCFCCCCCCCCCGRLKCQKPEPNER